MIVTVTFTASSHPDFPLFASARWAGRQVATRGDRVQVDEWIDRLRTTAARHEITVHVVDETRGLIEQGQAAGSHSEDIGSRYESHGTYTREYAAGAVLDGLVNGIDELPVDADV